MSMITKQYKTSLTVLGAVAAAGLVLQFTIGAFNILTLAFPVSVAVAALVVLAVAGLALYREKAAFRLLSGIPFSVAAIGALLVCCLVMGLVPQGGQGLLNAVTSFWPFVLIYLTLLLSLGCVIARALADFSLRRWAFYCNHIGLWLVLTGAGIGHADYRELTVEIAEGEEDRVQKFEFMNLPFRVRLDDFRMEEYPVKWGVVDIRTGRFQPEKSPVYYDTEQDAFAKNTSPGTHERIASTRPEPKSFASDVTVTLPDGKTEHAAIEVNHPYRHGSWAIYQSGYDQEVGPGSTYSIFKAVRDPWLPVVYAGILMLAAGALSMLVTRRKSITRNS